ncbi:cryptochrome/photolyase family protein [Streptomyces sp. bgisy100]|uniref:cryptochrome/photolyase family protein n=1 Tax=Streptomyces sp. bgisy100 TaxID=3413783 RepID=UPI003D73034A
MRVSIALFTSDLRVHDQPALRAALRGADEVVPLFVVDSGVREAGFDAPNRRAFLADCLADLDARLRDRGGRLVIRTGDVVEQVCRVAYEAGARRVHIAGGVSGYALRREERLRAALREERCDLQVHDAVITALPPGAVTPSDRDHFAVFTPYFRRWENERLRDRLGAPRVVRVPEGIRSDDLVCRTDLKGVSPGLAAGGETEGRRRLKAWTDGGIDAYADRHDDLAGDATSRLSPYLHFGALSPVELVHRSRQAGGAGAEAFVRQLAWRDFHHQVLAARPEASYRDYRTRQDRWRRAPEEAATWREGRTGYPVVDAAMRQLSHEGWMHNRARLLAASFLAKTLYIDWRVGAQHFLDLLVDGDVANNQLNWQWVAGTGTDTRPNRVLNPLAQAKRFDPRGEYVRRWVPELAEVDGPAVHRPWDLPAEVRDRLDYPEPVVDLGDGLARFQEARGIG